MGPLPLNLNLEPKSSGLSREPQLEQITPKQQHPLAAPRALGSQPLNPYHPKSANLSRRRQNKRSKCKHRRLLPVDFPTPPQHLKPDTLSPRPSPSYLHTPHSLSPTPLNKKAKKARLAPGTRVPTAAARRQQGRGLSKAFRGWGSGESTV